MTPQPPPLATALLRRVLPSGAAGLSVLGDLAEEFAERAARPRAARRWYWRQALILTVRYTLQRPPPLAMPTGPGRAFGLVNDVRAAGRAIAKEPGSASLIVFTLGTAIAVATIGFAFADLALLVRRPVDDPAQVVSIQGVDARQTDGRARLSPANFRDLRDRTQTLQHLAGFQRSRITLVERGIPTSLDAFRCTSDYFLAMGQRPALGRLLITGDDRAESPPVVVLAHHYWAQVYEGRPLVPGTTLVLDGHPHVVVGVASPRTEIGNLSTIDVYVPLPIDAEASRAERTLTVVGRLRAGESVESANAEIAALAATIADEHRDVNQGWHVRVIPILEAIGSRNFRLIVTLFLLTITLVIGIACANVASLTLARLAERRRELALRAALGASRARVVRHALVEGLILSLSGAALAVPLAEMGLRAIRAFDAEPALQHMRLDWHEAAFLAGVALASPLLFALLPAVSATRVDLRSALQTGSARSGRSVGRARAALTVLQLAFAVTLLTVAGVAVRTALNLMALDPGLRTERVLTFGMEFPAREYPTPEALSGVLDDVRRVLAPLPGVESVHVLSALPLLGDGPLRSLQLADQPSASGADSPWAFVSGVDAEALASLRVPLVAGRWFSDGEARRGDRLTVVGRATALRYFGSPEAAIGKRLTLNEGGADRNLEIVGVSGDVLTGDLERGPLPRVWTPLGPARRVSVMVLTATPPADLAGPVRRALAVAAPTVPAEALQPYAEALSRQGASDYVVIGVFALFAVLSVGLAATGLYGLVSYSVGQRVAEFGTRYALGAQTRDILGLVFRQSFGWLIVGLGLGLAGGRVLTGVMRNVLYGVSPGDPLNLLAVSGLLGLVTLIASTIPALRASRVNLVKALRAD